MIKPRAVKLAHREESREVHQSLERTLILCAKSKSGGRLIEATNENLELNEAGSTEGLATHGLEITLSSKSSGERQ